MKILVTGGAGYIGSVLVERLLKLGHSVRVIDNFFFGQFSLNHLCYHDKLDIIAGDIRDKHLIDEQMTWPDVIIPLAALVGAPICKKFPDLADDVNRESAKYIIDQKSPEQWMIMPTTNSAYGSGQGNKMCDETSPLNPLSKYARDKVEVENFLMSKTNVVSFRLATVFGVSPRMRVDLLVNDFVFKAAKDGTLVLFEKDFNRNFIHVRDVVNAMVFSIENFESVKGEIFNIGLSSANMSKLQLAQRIKEHVPSLQIFESDFDADPDKRDYIVSNAKIENLGWKPEYSIDRGIRELLKFYNHINNSFLSNV